MRTQYLSYFTGFRPGCQAISQRFETFETGSPPSNVPSPHIPRSMVRTSNPLVGDGPPVPQPLVNHPTPVNGILNDGSVGDGLACPARGGEAIPAHFGAMAGISHLDTDCHTSDIGHWFAMTVFSVASGGVCQMLRSGRILAQWREFPPLVVGAEFIDGFRDRQARPLRQRPKHFA